MNRIPIIVAALGWAVGCVPDVELSAPGTVCAEAQDQILDCGAALGVLSSAQCRGPARLIAECLVDRGDSCERLATITFDECVNEANERLLPSIDDEEEL